MSRPCSVSSNGAPFPTALTPQSRLGHYQIRSLVSVGGMGEVYLAEDLTLHRSVAIKSKCCLPISCAMPTGCTGWSARRWSSPG